MINYRGLWLPEGETHLQGWMDKVNHLVDGKPTYQYHKLERALGEVQPFRVAVDIGAHAGLWSMHLTQRFKTVLAFEPVEAHRRCFERNVAGHFVLYPMCLGERRGRVDIQTNPTSSGDTYPVAGDACPLEVFDDLYPAIADVDFVKVDCEGYELYALRGMRETLLRCRPVVIVEQKPGRASKYGLAETEAVTWLEALGMRLVAKMSGDYLLTW